MKTRSFIKSALTLLSVGLMTVGCSDFLDVNENPNDPSISTPSLTLPVAQVELASLNARDMTYLGQYIAYNWATPSNWSANTDFARYNVTSNFYGGIFERSYGSIFKNLTYVENYEDPSGAVDYSAYKAISSILKGFQYQYLVDLYGDVPYTEANKRSENPTPKYDDAETIYKANIDALTAAAVLAQNLPDNAENPGSQDVIFDGDMDAWASFANSIKLRMLVRLSNTGQDAYIKEQIALINANGAGYIESDVAVNPGYAKDNGKQNPFYGYFVKVDDGQTDRGDFTVASDYAITQLTDTNDDRLERLYALSKNNDDYKGAPQNTALPGEGFTSNDLSKVGPGLLTAHTQDQPIMLVSESLLVQAEAIVRGYIPGGDAAAQALYEDAITESYLYLEVEDAETAAEAYYTQSIANVSWASSNDKIAAIIYQKWVALNGTSSIELWIEKTRTGFPAGLPIPVESNGIRPVRLLYPVSEIGRNKDNVPSQTADDAFTNYPFWK